MIIEWKTIPIPAPDNVVLHCFNNFTLQSHHDSIRMSTIVCVRYFFSFDCKEVLLFLLPYSRCVEEKILSAESFTRSNKIVWMLSDVDVSTDLERLLHKLKQLKQSN